MTAPPGLAPNPQSRRYESAEAKRPDPIQGTSAPPYAERRPTLSDEAPSEVIAATTTRVRHITWLRLDRHDRRLGCPAGCPLDHHECGVDEPLEVIDPAPCTGVCHSKTVDELRYAGERYGACPCTLGVAS